MPKKTSKKEKDRYRCSLLPFEREEVLSIQDANQKIGWEITAFNLPSAWKISQGEGVKVAVLDTGCDLDHSDLVGNLLPGKNFVNPRKDPDDDNGHGCISPNCMIHTTYGGIEEIQQLYETIDQEELVETKKEGKYYIKHLKNIFTYAFDVENKKTIIAEIESIQKLPINSKVVRVELEGGIKYLLTPWHPVYLSNKEVIRKRADEIGVGDLFIFGRGELCGKLGKTQKINLPSKWECANCGHQPKYVINSTPSKCKKCKCFNWNLKSKEINVDTNLAYLAGITITDGHICNDRFEVTSTTPEILKKIENIVKIYGWNYKVEEKRILVYGKTACEHVVAMGIQRGKKSLTQTMPKWVGMAESEVQAAFIAGVIDGDGCISKSNTKNRITTASYIFGKEMCCLLNSWGISTSLGNPQYDRRTNRRIVSIEPCYKITHAALTKEIIKHLIHPKKIIRSKIIPKNKRSGRRVKSIIVEHYEGYFYDFTIKKYHNYIAEGHFVSNTHVTGILCAENNDIGMVGVAPKCKVIPVKVLDHKGAGNLLNVANGIRWAADQGVDFITMSLGSPNPVQQVRKAIQYAASKGVVIFCAAGNAGKTRQIFYPANYPETIGIGAIDENFDRANFSCTGDDLDFLAPGVKIFSTVPDNWYAVLSGTSMANPFATGLAVLVLSYKRKNNLNIKLENADDYRRIFRSNTIPTNNPEFAGKKFFEGFGIIDPRKMEEWVRVNG
jgi:subtilisin family serine protease